MTHVVTRHSEDRTNTFMCIISGPCYGFNVFPSCKRPSEKLKRGEDLSKSAQLEEVELEMEARPPDSKLCAHSTPTPCT